MSKKKRNKKAPTKPMVKTSPPPLPNTRGESQPTVNDPTVDLLHISSTQAIQLDIMAERLAAIQTFTDIMLQGRDTRDGSDPVDVVMGFVKRLLNGENNVG